MDLQQLVIEEFGGENAQRQYRAKAEEGLWESEIFCVNKSFDNRRGKLLDLGCGTGRTTIPLSKMGYEIVGVDLVPRMIETAKDIAGGKSLNIDYRVGDATKLQFVDNAFDYVFFSNNGWSQIPDSSQRLQALKEMRRVVKPGGIIIFTSHRRVIIAGKYFAFWLWQLIRFYVLKPLGFEIQEMDFGDRFFDRENSDSGKTFKSKQYIHIASVGEVKKQIKEAGLKLIEANGKLGMTDQNKYPPVFYVCEKI